MLFAYTAKNPGGQTVTARLECESLASARAHLRREGLFVVTIEEASRARTSVSTAQRWMQRVSANDLMMFLSQLTIMTQAGVDLAEALHNATEQTLNPSFQKVLKQVCDDVSSGQSFSAAMSKHPHAFTPALVAGVEAGERTGEIAPVLSRLTQLIRNDVKLRSSIKSMMMYPAVLSAVTLLVVVALTFIVLPQFAEVFEDMGRTPPPLTQAIVGFGVALRGNWMIAAGIAAIAAVAGLISSKTEAAKRLRDRTLLHFFLFRKPARALVTGRMLRLLGTLLNSGVPLLDCLKLCQKAISNRLFVDLLKDCEAAVVNGEGLAATLNRTPILPAGVGQMIRTAERSGNLAGVVQTIGEFYEDEGERYLRDVVKIAEPVIIVNLGGVVAVIVLAVLLPLLDVTTAAR